MGWAMVPDTIEYGERKTGIRTEGLVYSTFSFCQKLGMALSGVLTGAVLSYFNYTPEAGIHADAIFGIVILFTIVPLILSLMSVALLNFYTITEQDFVELQESTV